MSDMRPYNANSVIRQLEGEVKLLRAENERITTEYVEVVNDLKAENARLVYPPVNGTPTSMGEVTNAVEVL